MSRPSLARLSDAGREDLARALGEIGEPAFRLKQIRDWTDKKGVFAPERMTNLAAPLRAALTERFPEAPLTLREVSSSGDATEKLLFELSDGLLVESVLIPAADRTTVCLSSQVGCGVGCRFCASGMEGVKRNLTSGEIFEQFMLARARALESGRPLTNLVMMGMGEPMHNYENVFAALGRINSEDGPHFGARRITVSTIGIRKGVERFTEAKTQYTLAFSLHAPNDDLRRSIVPLRSAMSVVELRDAARRYLDTTGREVTFEYVLLAEVNDADAHADELVALLRGVRGLVNVIPWNPVPGLPYRRPSEGRIDRFLARLEAGGLKVSERRRKGSDIDAACGQLALRRLSGR